MLIMFMLIMFMLIIFVLIVLFFGICKTNKVRSTPWICWHFIETDWSKTGKDNEYALNFWVRWSLEIWKKVFLQQWASIQKSDQHVCYEFIDYWSCCNWFFVGVYFIFRMLATMALASCFILLDAQTIQMCTSKVFSFFLISWCSNNPDVNKTDFKRGSNDVQNL